MMKRSAIIEIEKREEEYRVELRDQETGEAIDSRHLDRTGDSNAPYKHVCKVSLPEEGEVTISFEEGGIVLRSGDRVFYRHELPTPVLAN